MIDVHQTDASEPGLGFGSQRFSRANNDTKGERGENDGAEDEEDEDEEEAAWLESVQADNLTDVQGMQASGLVLDVGQLREEPSAAKRSLKAKVGS